MKKLLNVTAFILIVGFVGSWECGNADFKTLLFNAGGVLSVLMVSQLSGIILKNFIHNKKVNKRKLA